MAPVEGEIYCTQEKGIVREITVNKAKTEKLNNFDGLGVTVLCNAKDSAGMAILTGDTDLARVIMFDKKIEDDSGRDLDPDYPIKFAGSKYVILTYAHSVEEIKLEHCHGDLNCAHPKVTTEKKISRYRSRT